MNEKVHNSIPIRVGQFSLRGCSTRGCGLGCGCGCGSEIENSALMVAEAIQKIIHVRLRDGFKNKRRCGCGCGCGLKYIKKCGS